MLGQCSGIEELTVPFPVSSAVDSTNLCLHRSFGRWFTFFVQSDASLDQLKDIVSENAMDSSKLALKWKSTGRLIELIVISVRSRVEKGDAFKRDFVSQR